jgi:hypothetical protein
MTSTSREPQDVFGGTAGLAKDNQTRLRETGLVDGAVE